MFPTVLISVPTTGHIRAELVEWMLRQRSPESYRVGFEFTIGRLGVAAQRNMAVNKALKGPVTHVLFVDDDVRPPLDIDVIGRMLAADKDVVTGAVPMITGKGMCLYSVYMLGPLIPDPDDIPENVPIFCSVPLVDRKSELQRVEGCGMAFCLINMDVFRRIPFPWFRSVDGAGRYLMGEDLYFCLKAYHAGVEIWVDWGIRCAHYKTMELSAEFGLDLETGEGWVRR